MTDKIYAGGKEIWNALNAHMLICAITVRHDCGMLQKRSASSADRKIEILGWDHYPIIWRRICSWRSPSRTDPLGAMGQCLQHFGKRLNESLGDFH